MGSEPNDLAQIANQVAATGVFENLAPPIQLALFLGSLAFLSTAIVSLTSFTRVVIVLSFVRRALSTQEIPPNPVVLGLSFFLTLFIMGPTLETVSQEAVMPYLEKKISGTEAMRIGQSTLQRFMLAQTRRQDLALFFHLAGAEPVDSPKDTPFRVLVPAFMISELKTAFIMGFCIYVPFLVIDLVVSSVLMSLGMMMMSPMIMSLPFKVLLFILVDGWQLVVQALSGSFYPSL